MIRFKCLACSKSYSAKSKYAGRKTKCAKCGNINVVPNLTTPKAPPKDSPSGRKREDAPEFYHSGDHESDSKDRFMEAGRDSLNHQEAKPAWQLYAMMGIGVAILFVLLIPFAREQYNNAAERSRVAKEELEKAMDRAGREGRHAWENGQPKSDNPYDDINMAASWASGHNTAEQIIKNEKVMAEADASIRDLRESIELMSRTSELFP